MALSNIEICQKALVLIGASPISSFTEGTTESLVADTIYEDTIEDCLAQAPWKFAKGQVEMNRLAQTPEDVWDAAYQIPTNPEPMSIRTVTVDDEPISYDRYEDHIYCNATENDTVVLTYTYRADEEDWTPMFKMYVILRLASLFAASITRKGDIVSAFEKKAESQFARAKAKDAQSTTNYKVKQTRLLSRR